MADVIEIKAFREDANIPTKATEGAAGYDLYAWLKDQYEETYLVPPHSVAVIKTGLNVNIPNGYEIQCKLLPDFVNKNGVTCIYISTDENNELYFTLMNNNRIPFSVRHLQKMGYFYLVQIY